LIFGHYPGSGSIWISAGSVYLSQIRILEIGLFAAGACRFVHLMDTVQLFVFVNGLE